MDFHDLVRKSCGATFCRRANDLDVIAVGAQLLSPTLLGASHDHKHDIGKSSWRLINGEVVDVYIGY